MCACHHLLKPPLPHTLWARVVTLPASVERHRSVFLRTSLYRVQTGCWDRPGPLGNHGPAESLPSSSFHWRDVVNLPERSETVYNQWWSDTWRCEDGCDWNIMFCYALFRTSGSAWTLHFWINDACVSTTQLQRTAWITLCMCVPERVRCSRVRCSVLPWGGSPWTTICR